MTAPPDPSVEVEPDGIAGYKKAIASLVTPLILLVADAWADGSITAAEWKTIAVAVIPTCLAVWFFRNRLRVTIGPPITTPPIVVEDVPDRPDST